MRRLRNHCWNCRTSGLRCELLSSNTRCETVRYVRVTVRTDGRRGPVRSGPLPRHVLVKDLHVAACGRSVRQWKDMHSDLRAGSAGVTAEIASSQVHVLEPAGDENNTSRTSFGVPSAQPQRTTQRKWSRWCRRVARGPRTRSDTH
eukprot:1261170-Prymnesium_polylepis.1